MADDLYPMLLETQMAPKDWGSEDPSPFFHNPGLGIGEVWLLADGPLGSSRVATGPLAGMSLERLRALFGSQMFGGRNSADSLSPLPLEIKIYRGAKASDLRLLSSGRFIMVLERKYEEGFLWLGDALPEADAKDGLIPLFWPELLESRPSGAGQCFWAPQGLLCRQDAGLTILEIGLAPASGGDLLLEGPADLEQWRGFWADDNPKARPLGLLSQEKGKGLVFENEFFSLEIMTTDYYSGHTFGDQALFLVPLYGQGRLLTQSASPRIRLLPGGAYFLPASLGRYGVESASSLTFLRITFRSY